MDFESPKSRLLIVSNRLPVTVTVDGAEVRVAPSAGGLATGLRGPHERTRGLWIGWPGDLEDLSEEQHAAVTAQLTELRTVPVELSREEVKAYYEGFSNGVLWPLFHYLLDLIPLGASEWNAYRAANERFAEAVVREYRPGDLVWVQDYQLLLVPALLRKKIPRARIGFFLHIPFPSSEVFRTLPWREAILEGLLGADLVGFHTFPYLRHFTTSLLRILGVEAEVDRASFEGREVRLGVFPMGVDAEAFRRLALDAGVLAEAESVRAQHGGNRLLIGVDRLDYTKGIPRRLLAIERLLEHEPSLRGRIRFVQIAVPSRSGVDAYAQFQRQVHEIVGRVNGLYGTVEWAPIHYLTQNFDQRQLAALYRAADVALVTPLRDGMNLVAKEFVASREDEDGVLVLSEFAGAASELGEALLVNPYDIDRVAATLAQALTMPEAERRERMRGLRRRVFAHDVNHWVEQFLLELSQRPEGVPILETSPDELARGVTERLASAAGRDLVLLLDYDGTLVAYSHTPDRAAPDEALLALLATLSARPGIRVHLLSGWPREWLERWFGGLPIALHAEHGFWSRNRLEEPWRPAAEIPSSWTERALKILEEFARRTPGAWVEEQTASLAWHYRGADPEFGSLQAKELRLYLTNALSNAPVEVALGNKFVEVRPHGVHKGMIASKALAKSGAIGAIVALGDDRTDEDLFAALPEGAFTVSVGARLSRARYRLASPAEVRVFLGELADG